MLELMMIASLLSDTDRASNDKARSAGGRIGMNPPWSSISFLNPCRISWLHKRAVPAWAHRVVQGVREAAAEEGIRSAHPDPARVARKVRGAPAFPALGRNRSSHPHAAPVVRRVREAAACPVGRTE